MIQNHNNKQWDKIGTIIGVEGRNYQLELPNGRIYKGIDDT